MPHILLLVSALLLLSHPLTPPMDVPLAARPPVRAAADPDTGGQAASATAATTTLITPATPTTPTTWSRAEAAVPEGLVRTDRFVVAVEVEAVIPDADPSEPCYEPQVVELLREVERRARSGDLPWLLKHGKVYEATKSQ